MRNGTNNIDGLTLERFNAVADRKMKRRDAPICSNYRNDIDNFTIHVMKESRRISDSISEEEIERRPRIHYLSLSCTPNRVKAIHHFDKRARTAAAANPRNLTDTLRDEVE